jgi:hypothetical protein
VAFVLRLCRLGNIGGSLAETDLPCRNDLPRGQVIRYDRADAFIRTVGKRCCIMQYAMQAAIGDELRAKYEQPTELTPELSVILTKLDKSKGEQK